MGENEMPRYISVVFCIIAFLAPRAFAAEGKRPNIVYIMTDDQGRWACSTYGNKECRTPNMDRIGREGAVFDNAFVATPVCSPSRLEFFTGLYGTQCAITDWINDTESVNGLGIPQTAITWPQVLQQNGYVTALCGKWHLGGNDEFAPPKHGFSHFYGFRGGGNFPMNPLIEVDMGKKKTIPGPIGDLITTDAINFLEQNKDKPFALCLFFREPHLPYGPMPKEDVEPFKDLDPTVPNDPHLDEKQVKNWTHHYYEAIHCADRNIGRVLDKLDELKLTDNTIVMFTSDHGYNIGQHLVHTKGNATWIVGGMKTSKRPNMWETSIRVPLVVRWPGVVKPGTKIDQTVCNIDSFKTILGMLNVPVPADTKPNGTDYSRILRGESVDWNNDLYGQYDLHNSGLAFMRMVRTPQWKLVRHHMSYEMNELYDLAHDPDETKNLYYDRANQKIRDELQSKLTKWQQSINDPLLKMDAGRPIEIYKAGGE
jgi:uncharacterized sulfatase